MAHFHGEIANEDAKILVQKVKIGGVIYYNWANGLSSPKQVQTLSANLQELACANPTAIPLLIATDQEGGVVARLNKGFTQFPGNKALGETGDPQLAEETAFAMGLELKAVGINMNLAPVIDINSNPCNPVIGVRSFGEHAETVITFGKQALKGYRKAKIIATLKHFPGYGDVAVDPHEDLPVIRKTKEELQQVELLPFVNLSKDADAIMTAHLLVPALDMDNCSTLSEKTLTYLREIIGFQGVIVADSLVMEGVLKKCQTVDEAAIQALNAGCDILILGGKLLSGERTGFELTVADVQRIHLAIVNAVKSGRISEERLNQAVEKILNLKNCYHIDQTTDKYLKYIPNSPTHQALAQKVASLALKIVKRKDNSIIPFYEKKITVFAPQLLKENIQQTSLLTIGKKVDSYFFINLNPSAAEISAAKQKATEAEILFVCSYNAWKNPSQITFIQSLIETEKPTIILVTRDPLDAFLFPKAQLILNTFSPVLPSIQAVCNYLTSSK